MAAIVTSCLDWGLEPSRATNDTRGRSPATASMGIPRTVNTDLISETLRSVGTIVVLTLIGAVLGLFFGCVLGLLTPDLFRALFGARHVAVPNGGPVMTTQGHPLDPLQIGIGLGLINGAIMGFIAGLVTVIASTWLRVRRIAAGSE